MKIMNREIGYAFRALCYMYMNKDEMVTTSQLAEIFKISRPFLRKVLQKLNKAGILYSYKGKNGGFKISLPEENVLLIDLIEVFQGSVQFSGCYGKGKECPLLEECPVRTEIEELENKFIHDLSRISLKTMLDKKRKINLIH